MENKQITGHMLACITIVIWGTTFISTKILLEEFQPLEILFFRFLLGFFALIAVCPKWLTWTGWRRELTFAAAGFTGICLYYLLENVALTFTMASNVGVIISIAPFFTAILSRVFLRETENPQLYFYIGFIIAMLGICLINFNGTRLYLNPFGDLLSVAAAIVWACYSILSKKISAFGLHTILTTRRVFFYGILFMIPFLAFGDFRIDIGRFSNIVYMGNMIFLGLGASALCFVTWNSAVRVLGAVKTSVYIYLVPVITMAASALILHEKITVMAAAGAAFTLLGLLFSERKGKK